MKLEPEHVRTVMLDFESHLTWDGKSVYLLGPSGMANYDSYRKIGHDNFVYTVSKLIEAHYLEGNLRQANNTIKDVMVSSITWKGHELLDNTRDPEVWKNTKRIADKFASVSINMVSNIAAQVISNLIKDQMRLM